MKTSILLFITGLLFVFTSCASFESTIGGKLTNQSECNNSYNVKSEVSESKWLDTPDSMSCAEYSYNPEKQELTLIHRNAGFNCCPGPLSGNISMINDTIVIEERESNLGILCDCNCLYDLTFVLTDVSTQNYVIKFIEPYAKNATPLIFDIDLKLDESDIFCVVRKNYPWMGN
ncbi:MAG TPA: hypothetical protein P5084_14695 [Paludibacter sp.]|nr:hypothetical protein [Paludibacter sp.]